MQGPYRDHARGGPVRQYPPRSRLNDEWWGMFVSGQATARVRSAVTVKVRRSAVTERAWGARCHGGPRPPACGWGAVPEGADPWGTAPARGPVSRGAARAHVPSAVF